MAYRYKLREPISEGTRRIARDQISNVRTKLSAGHRSDSAIHESRKSLKRVRALLRLVRPAIGDKPFCALNAEIRDIGALLSPERDRQILLETAQKLEDASNASHVAAFSALKRAIKQKQRVKKPIRTDVTALVLKKLAATSKRFSKLVFNGKDLDCIERGLEVSVSRARREMRRAFDDYTDEAFHEWRKAAQLHWRHMQLLTPAWPSMFASRAEAGRTLSQLLGDDHDLSVLMAFAQSLPAKVLSSTQAKTIHRLAMRRQKELRAIAKPHGMILFAERPGSFAKRIRRTWEAALLFNDDNRKSIDSKRAKKEKPVMSAGKTKTKAKTKVDRASKKATKKKAASSRRTHSSRSKNTPVMPGKDRRH